MLYTPTTSDDRVEKVVSGVDHVLALTAGGAVYSWGCGEKGRLGRCPADVADYNEKDDKGIIAKLVEPQQVPLQGLGAKVTALVAGSYHCFAIAYSDDGRSSEVFGWGLNNYGQLGEGHWVPPITIHTHTNTSFI